MGVRGAKKLVERDLKDLDRTSALPTTNAASQQLEQCLAPSRYSINLF